MYQRRGVNCEDKSWIGYDIAIAGPNENPALALKLVMTLGKKDYSNAYYPQISIKQKWKGYIWFDRLFCAEVM